MIPLDKNPGVRPTGGGKALRKIIKKVIGWVLKGKIQEVAGPLQAGTRFQGRAETIFEDDKNCDAGGHIKRI